MANTAQGFSHPILGLGYQLHLKSQFPTLSVHVLLLLQDQIRCEFLLETSTTPQKEVLSHPLSNSQGIRPASTCHKPLPLTGNIATLHTLCVLHCSMHENLVGSMHSINTCRETNIRDKPKFSHEHHLCLLTDL